jgi:Zn-dependent protease
MNPPTPSWDDSDERTRPSGFGGDWRGSRVSFDDPMSWSLPLFRVAGIAVRLHLFFLAFVVVVLARALSAGGDTGFGLLPSVLGLVALFGVILLHEFGHCIACRMVGGRADEILLWPLGGLATCDPPRRASANFWTAAGGPLVNVAIMAVLTPFLGFRYGQWLGFAIPNPLDLGGLLHRVDFDGWWMMFLVLTNAVAWFLLLFNLIPMFPLDGGRLLQAVLWSRSNYQRSMRVACRSGLVGAVVVGVLALVTDSTALLGIALFGGVVCYATAKQLEHEREFLGFDPDEFDPGADGLFEPLEVEDIRSGSSQASAAVKAADSKAAEALHAREAEIDRILAKIAEKGMDALSRAERETLRQATESKRDSEGGGGKPRG